MSQNSKTWTLSPVHLQSGGLAIFCDALAVALTDRSCHSVITCLLPSGTRTNQIIDGFVAVSSRRTMNHFSGGNFVVTSLRWFWSYSIGVLVWWLCMQSDLVFVDCCHCTCVAMLAPSEHVKFLNVAPPFLIMLSISTGWITGGTQTRDDKPEYANFKIFVCISEIVMLSFWLQSWLIQTWHFWHAYKVKCRNFSLSVHICAFVFHLLPAAHFQWCYRTAMLGILREERGGDWRKLLGGLLGRNPTLPARAKGGEREREGGGGGSCRQNEEAGVLEGYFSTFSSKCPRH